MIAVIERAHQVVWGYGRTSAEAMTDAQRWIAEWKQAMAKDGKPARVGTLEYAQLNAPEEELGSGGDWLYQWVTLPESAPVQDGLF